MKKLITAACITILFAASFLIRPASAAALTSGSDVEECVTFSEEVTITVKEPDDVAEAPAEECTAAVADEPAECGEAELCDEAEPAESVIPEQEAEEITDTAAETCGIPDEQAEAADDEPTDEPVVALTAVPDGWVSAGGATRYYSGGTALTGFQRIGGGLFCFGSDGALLTGDGWHTVDGKKYYILGGEVLTGCRTIDGAVYLFGEDGVFSGANGLVGDKFYVGGRAVTGPQKVGSDMYLFDIAGRRVTTDGWKTVADENSTQHTYYVANGVLLNGFADADGVLRLFKDYEPVSGSGWTEIEKGKYYILDGKVYTGMNLIDNKMYFLDPAANGVLRTGWLKLYGTRYHADNAGVITRGAVFTQDGVMYAADSNGAVVTGGFTTVGSKKYYADGSGALAQNKKFAVDGKSYVAGSDGVIKAGVKFDFSGKTYISDETGALRKGWIKYSGYYYYGSDDCSLLKNTKIDGFTLDTNGRRVTDEAAVAAGKLIDSVTKASMSNSEKLRTSFNWLVNNCSYKRDYTDPTKLSGNWRNDYALDMLNTHKGNCYRYASAFAYIAEELGYDAQVVCGRVSAVGGGTTPHAFTQITIDGKTYICDANLQSTRPSYNWYMISYNQYHYYFVKQKVYEVSVA